MGLEEGNGGDEGIRTLDELLAHTPLAGERLRPLGHVSVGGTSELRRQEQAISELKLLENHSYRRERVSIGKSRVTSTA